MRTHGRCTEKVPQDSDVRSRIWGIGTAGLALLLFAIL